MNGFQASQKYQKIRAFLEERRAKNYRADTQNCASNASRGNGLANRKP